MIGKMFAACWSALALMDATALSRAAERLGLPRSACAPWLQQSVCAHSRCQGSGDPEGTQGLSRVRQTALRKYSRNTLKLPCANRLGPPRFAWVQKVHGWLGVTMSGYRGKADFTVARFDFRV
jgi:hypothetical protein